MKRLNILFAVFIFATSLFAQTDFRPGYVIKTEGDTLYGEIDYRGDKLMGHICTFRPNKNGEVSTFAPGEIFGYRFIDSKYFVSKIVGDKNVFLEYLINGKVKIYYLRDDVSDHYFIEKEGEKLMELTYEEGIRRKNDKEYFYKSTKHIGILSYYMQDAPDLIALIQKMPEPEHKNLIQLAEKYHNEVCDGERCIIYEKKLPPIKVNFEVLGGATHINSEITAGTFIPNYVLTGGVLAHIWLPRKSENLYLKTGLIFLNSENASSKIDIYKIPLQLEYLYPKGNIRPRASIGFDFLILEPACSVGVNIKITKHLYLSVNYDMNFYSKYSKLNLPDSFLSHSLYAGLYLAL
jgi:hypothetical protein